VVRKKGSTIFKDFASHEVAKIFKISQNLPVNTQCVTMQRKNIAKGSSLQQNNHKTYPLPH
jgi:hypothetical protein